MKLQLLGALTVCSALSITCSDFSVVLSSTGIKSHSVPYGWLCSLDFICQLAATQALSQGLWKHQQGDGAPCSNFSAQTGYFSNLSTLRRYVSPSRVEVPSVLTAMTKPGKAWPYLTLTSLGTNLSLTHFVPVTLALISV